MTPTTSLVLGGSPATVSRTGATLSSSTKSSSLTSTSFLDSSGSSGSSGSSTIMSTSLESFVYSTTTFTSTIYCTSTTVVDPSTFIVPGASTLSTLPSTTLSSTASGSTGSTSRASLPGVVTAVPSEGHVPTVISGTSASVAFTTAPVSEAIGRGPVSTRASVLGGVLGSVSALAVIAAIMFLILRRRRKRESSNETTGDQSSKFLFWRNGSRTDTREPNPGEEKEPPRLPPLRGLPVIEENLIRISLDHWERPYARDDPFRDLEKSSPLRVTNPDPTRPNTPRIPTNEHPGRFLQRQRSALAELLFPFKRSASSQSLPQHSAPPSRTSNASAPVRSSPVTDSGLSKELRVGSAPRTPTSLRSLRSNTSSQSTRIIRPRPPDDPFAATTSAAAAGRPSLSTVQEPGSARTASHLGGILTAFRIGPSLSRSTSVTSVPRSEWSHTRSDQFDLDRPSGAWRVVEEGHESGSEKSYVPSWRVHAYEGT